MFIAEESVVSREGRRVGGCQHQVLLAVDECTLLLGIGTPKDEHQVLPLVGQCTDGCVGKFLPTLALVRACLVSTYGECGVQHQHALFSPSGEVSARRNLNAEVALDFLEDILKGGWKGHAVVHREAKPVCLSGAMIGVLPDDDYLCLMKRAEVEGIKDEFARRVDGGGAIFGTHEVGQPDEIILLKFGVQLLFPAFFYLYIHGFFHFKGIKIEVIFGIGKKRNVILNEVKNLNA